MQSHNLTSLTAGEVDSEALMAAFAEEDLFSSVLATSAKGDRSGEKSGHLSLNHHVQVLKWYAQAYLEKHGVFEIMEWLTAELCKRQPVKPLRYIFTLLRRRLISAQTKLDSFNQPQVILVTGGPCAGKSTVCQRLCSEYGWAHIRMESKIAFNEAEMGEFTDDHRFEIIANSLSNRIHTDFSHGKSVFVVDGFPDSENMFKFWMRMDLEKSITIRRILFLRVSPSILAERMKLDFPCDDGIELYQRAKNYEIESAKMMHLIDSVYNERVHKIDGELYIDTVYDSIGQIIDDFNMESSQMISKLNVINNSSIDNQTIALNCSVVFIVAPPYVDAATIVCQRLEGKQPILVQNSVNTTIYPRNTYQHFVYLSISELLQQELNLHSKRARAMMIRNFMKNGDPIPEDIVVQVLLDAMRTYTPQSCFLIEGFACSIEYVEAWNQIANQHTICTPNAFANITLLYFEFDERELERCAIQSNVEVGRDGDREEFKLKFAQRLQMFNRVTLPVIEHYKVKGCVYIFNAEQSKDDLFDQVVQMFQRL